MEKFLSQHKLVELFSYVPWTVFILEPAKGEKKREKKVQQINNPRMD